MTNNYRLRSQDPAQVVVVLTELRSRNLIGSFAVIRSAPFADLEIETSLDLVQLRAIVDDIKAQHGIAEPVTLIELIADEAHDVAGRGRPTS